MQDANSTHLLRLYGAPVGVIPDKKRNLPGIVPVSRSTWWQWVQDGKTPAPVRVGRCTFWREQEIRAFVESLT